MAEIYILLGPEEGTKNNYISSIRKRVLSSYPDAECYSFFVGDDDEASYTAAVSQASLFSSYRFIVLRGWENVKKTDSVYKETIEAAKSGQDDLTLIIVSTDSSSLSWDKSLTSAAGKDRTVTFWELTEDDKRNWIMDAVAKENFRITRDAVEEILTSVENNTAEMKSLVLSITNFLRIKGEKNVIERDDIEAYSTFSKGENGYSLFRYIAECDLDKALRAVDSIILNDQRDLLAAVTVIANQFRRVEEALRMKKRGTPDAVIFKELNAFSTYSTFKARSGVNFREADIFRKAMRNYSLEDVSRIILFLGKSDTEVKASSTDSLLLTAEMICYTIIVEKGRTTPLSLSIDTLVSPDPFV